MNIRVSPIKEEIAEVLQAVPQAQIQGRVAEQNVDVAVPLLKEEIAEVPQKHIQKEFRSRTWIFLSL